MKKLCTYTVFLLCVSILHVAEKTAAEESERAYQIGESWVYQHKGPKIERYELFWDLDTFKGERTREVVSVELHDGKKYWVIKESFGATDPFRTLHYVDDRSFIVKFASGASPAPPWVLGDTISLNKPAYPFDFVSLKIGEEKEFKSQRLILPQYFTYPITIKFRRLEDQTIEVPAGKFGNCQHFKVSISYTIPRFEFAGDWGQYSISRDTDLWFHPRANGIVKEITHSDPFEFLGEIRQGFTITSVLKSHSKGE